MTEQTDKIRQEAIDHILFPELNSEDLQRMGPCMLEKGEGLYVWDIDGNRYLDGGSSGVFAVGVGYGREEIARAMYEQAAKLHYFSPFGYATPIAVEFAKKLAEVLPGELSVSYMTNDGSEALEGAFKVVRQYWYEKRYPRRYKIIARRGAYHGATMGALAACGTAFPLRQICEPLPPGYYFAASPYCYRCEFGFDYPNCDLQCASSIETIIKQESPDQIAAVVGEVVMGTSGIIPPAPEYWPKVREICDKYGTFLIDDEVVCGFGRTGKWFAIQHYGVTPDVMGMAKGLSSSYMPLGATAVSKRIADGIPSFWDVHTYNHHPVSCAAGLKNIEIIQRENLVANSEEMGRYLLAGLQAMASDHPSIGEARGLGLMAAVEFVKDRKTREPFADTDYFAPQIVDEARKKGLLLRSVGLPSIIALVPCLTVTKNQIDEMLRIVDEVLVGVEKSHGF